MDERNLPSPCVVVLVGPGAAGKSSWAAETFAADLIVSSDRLRALVGAGEDDLAASADAFTLLEEVVRQRIGRRLTTVIDTLGLDRDRRVNWLRLAREQGIPCVVVAFDTPAAECRRRNRERAKRIPADVLTGQLKAFGEVKKQLPDEGYDEILTPRTVRVVPEAFVGAAEAVQRQQEAPTQLRFGLQLSSYTHKAGRKATAEWIKGVASKAEAAGFDGDLCDGPLPADSAGGAGLGGLPRELDDARLSRRLHRAGEAGDAGHRDHVPERRAPGEDRRDARRAQRGSCGVWTRARLVRGGAQGVRVGLPVGQRSLCPARRRAAATPGVVGTGQQTLAWQGSRRTGDCLLPAPAAGSAADPARRQRQAHPQTCGPVRRCRQCLR